MQDSVAELTDDVTELKENMQEVKANEASFERRIAMILEVLDQASKTVHETAMNHLRYEQEANERMARSDERMARSDERMTQVEASVQKLSDTVDRYLSARLNGGSKN